jgi:crotonobetainyl-CoA:carnitine CoA-transferase CaiB-like acyl-CoA transferase
LRPRHIWGATGARGIATKGDPPSVDGKALKALFAAHPRAHWADVFAGSDACAAPVLSPEEAARDPHLAARGTWTTAGALQPAPAPRYMGEAMPEPAPARPRDGDRAAILAELGLQPENR